MNSTLNSTLHQLTCVALKGRAVLISGPSGSGKSSLALALIDRGARLVGDDGVSLSIRAGRLIASPAPKTRGLCEVRNVGLITLPVQENVPVALLLTLDPEAPRYIEAPHYEKLPDATGVALPMVALWPDSPILALRAEWALARHGLEG